MRFLKKHYLTEPRVKALEILGIEEVSLKTFSWKMWGCGCVGFGSYFLGGLIGLGLVETSRTSGDLNYRATAEGRTLLATRPWKCGYCGAGKVSSGTIVDHPCRTCKANHWTCKTCLRKQVVSNGEFPDYRPALRNCPPGGGRS